MIPNKMKIGLLKGIIKIITDGPSVKDGVKIQESVEDDEERKEKHRKNWEMIDQKKINKALDKMNRRVRKENKGGDFIPLIKFSDLQDLMKKYEREDMDDKCLQSFINTYSNEPDSEEDVEIDVPKAEFDKQEQNKKSSNMGAGTNQN